MSMIDFEEKFFLQGGKKLERARDLFEQCLDSCPAKNAKGIFFNCCVPKETTVICFCVAFYLLYVKLEEQYGLARHAMSVYERATSALPNDEKLEVHPWLKF